MAGWFVTWCRVERTRDLRLITELLQPIGQFLRILEALVGNFSRRDGEFKTLLEVDEELHHGQGVETEREEIRLGADRFITAEDVVLINEADD